MIDVPDLSGVAGVIGVGIDVVEIDRFRRVLARRPRVIERVFSTDERESAGRRTDPTEFFAARFAAKEAVLKVLGVGIFDLPLTAIEVRGGGHTAPWLSMDPAVTACAAELGIGEWRLSLTHAGQFAAAVVVGLRSPLA